MSHPEVAAQPKPKAEAPPAVAETKTPAEWAQQLGHIKLRWLPTEAGPVKTPVPSVPYNCATVLHGWREHEHHAGAPMQLTREQFDAALAAAVAARVDAEGRRLDGPDAPLYQPHTPALSPHKGRRR